jgi:hypothetical protein
MEDFDKYGDMRIVSTAHLETIIKQGNTMDFNRQLDPDTFTEMADPEGVHLVHSIMTHEHIAGKKVDPHLRCWVYIKEKNSDKPAQAIMDMTFEAFRSMQPVSKTDLGRESG